VLFDAKDIYIKQRTANDIWKGLFEFPVFESPQSTVNSQQIVSHPYIKKYGEPSTVDCRLSYKQTLSHQYINGHFYEIKLGKLPKLDKTYLKIPKNTILNYAFPKIVRSYLEDRLNFLT
jgi:A/G-specific adenine glycosylase